jgi:hypothetical protein
LAEAVAEVWCLDERDGVRRGLELWSELAGVEVAVVVRMLAGVEGDDMASVVVAVKEVVRVRSNQQRREATN